MIRTSPYIPYRFFGPLLLVQLASPIFWPSPGIKMLVASFGIGLAWWTFVEYAVHRFGFHLLYGKSSLISFAATFHEDHHRAPKQIDFLATPLSLSAPLYFLFVGIFGWVTRSPVAAAYFGSGILVGYLAYEVLHYLIHHRQLRNSLLSKLQASHLKHHYENADRKYGVTSSLWDKILGTS